MAMRAGKRGSASGLTGRIRETRRRIARILEEARKDFKELAEESLRLPGRPGAGVLWRQASWRSALPALLAEAAALSREHRGLAAQLAIMAARGREAPAPERARILAEPVDDLLFAPGLVEDPRDRPLLAVAVGNYEFKCLDEIKRSLIPSESFGALRSSLRGPRPPVLSPYEAAALSLAANTRADLLAAFADAILRSLRPVGGEGSRLLAPPDSAKAAEEMLGGYPPPLAALLRRGGVAVFALPAAALDEEMWEGLATRVKAFTPVLALAVPIGRNLWAYGRILVAAEHPRPRAAAGEACSEVTFFRAPPGDVSRRGAPWARLEDLKKLMGESPPPALRLHGFELGVGYAYPLSLRDILERRRAGIVAPSPAGVVDTALASELVPVAEAVETLREAVSLR